MPSTTAYKRGDIVLVTFPFTDLTSSKKRPALVVSPDRFNRQRRDLVLAAITSQISGEPGTVVIDGGDVIHGSLPKRSEVRLGKLFTVHTSLVRRRLCSLTDGKRENVLSAMRSFFT
jgi:mRNA interferase MazF